MNRKAHPYILLSVLIAGQANAWDFVVDKGGSAVYLDKQRTKREGSVVQALWVSNFKEPQRMKMGAGAVRKSSIVYLTTYDCQARSYFVQQAVWHDGPFGNGAGHTFQSRAAPQWRSADDKFSEGNLNVDVMLAVCK